MNNSSLQKESGFSLLEMTIFLVIAGILIVPLLHGYSLYLAQKKIDTTNNNIQTVHRAISKYVQLNQHLPCPAPLTADSDSPDNGRSADCSIASLAGTAGIFEVAGAIPGPDTEVVIGAVPFRQLSISKSHTVDGWGNRLTFAVTKRLAVPPPAGTLFNDTRGTVGLVDGANNALVDPAGTALYALVSHGENGAGAYSGSGGTLVRACSTAADGVDSRNCDNTDAIFVELDKRTASGATYFDDYAGAIKSLVPADANTLIPVCQTGQVLTNNNGTLMCVAAAEPPPECPQGQYLSMADGEYKCSNPFQDICKNRSSKLSPATIAVLSGQSHAYPMSIKHPVTGLSMNDISNIYDPNGNNSAPNYLMWLNNTDYGLYNSNARANGTANNLMRTSMPETFTSDMNDMFVVNNGMFVCAQEYYWGLPNHTRDIVPVVAPGRDNEGSDQSNPGN